MPKQVILFLAANPSGTTRVALDAECAAIERELRMMVERDFEFQSRWAVTVDELMHDLNALQPTVLHFSGHGAGRRDALHDASPGARDIEPTSGGSSPGGIYLEDDRRGPQLVTAEALTRMIRSAAASIRLVVLNACYSDCQADAVRQVVDCVVGMDGAIADDTARAFAVSFYRALGYRRSVANAVEQAAATLAGIGLAGDDLPRYRTRDGVDAANMVLSGPMAYSQSWGQRFDAVIRLAREAHEKLTADPFSTAARAQQAVEHIVSYLYEREIGGDWQAAVDAKLRRIEAKLVIPSLVAIHFGSVLMQTSSVIRSAAAADPEPDLLRPCLGSLARVIEWFFREYVKQPVPEFTWGPLDRRQPNRLPAPDITPINSTAPPTIPSTGTRFATAIGELTLIWRPRPTASALRIELTEGEPAEMPRFKIEDPEKIYFIGRTEQRSDGKRNDFALPKAWSSISRDQGTLMTEDGDVVLMNTSDKNNVYVRGELVARGCARGLRHADSVQLGLCVGVFEDGRYYPTAMAAAIDRRTGLLSRIGLIAEIGRALASGEPRLLFVIRCPADVMNPPRGIAAADPERKAVMVAAALHRHDPSIPIARIGVDVAMLLDAEDAVAAMALVAHRVSGTRSVSGFLKLHGTADQALPRLEACLGALSRIAIAGREQVGPEDLGRYALVPTSLDAFVGHAPPLFDVGGGAVLFVLGDLERLRRRFPQVLSVLELELVEMLGARMGPRDIVSFASPGLLFGTPGDVERFAREVTVAWHARGPVTANAFEIDRCLSAHLLTSSDLDDLVERAAALVRGEVAALDASGLPAPLALGAIAVDQAQEPIARARALVRLAELSWQLLAFILVASVRGMDVQGAIHDRARDTASGPQAWPAPWRSVARAAAHMLEGQSFRMMELASVAAAADREVSVRGRAADRDGSFREAMDAIAAAAESLTTSTPDRERIAASMPRLEKAVREVFLSLGPLRGWTLITIVKSEVVDVDGSAQRVEYIDYTGPSVRGASQRVTAIGFRGLGNFAYLVRWDEGLAIALEPFVRRGGDNELFLAVDLVAEPGQHRYRSISGTSEVEQLVTAKQLGIPTGRR